MNVRKRTAAEITRAYWRDEAMKARTGRPCFSRPAWGTLTITLGGLTYTATYYPTANGVRGYWTIQTSDRDYTSGNDWYEPSEARVRAAILADAAKRKL